MGKPIKANAVARTEVDGQTPISEVMRVRYIRPPVEYAIALGLSNHHEAGVAALKHVSALDASLLGPRPTALERLLVDRITACWWRVQESETAYSNASALTGTRELVLFHKRVERAQRMYLDAILALARVRKMALPDIQIQNQGQINIGQQQINVAEVRNGTEEIDAAS